jgi:hypothetical protein
MRIDVERFDRRARVERSLTTGSELGAGDVASVLAA